MRLQRSTSFWFQMLNSAVIDKMSWSSHTCFIIDISTRVTQTVLDFVTTVRLNCHLHPESLLVCCPNSFEPLHSSMNNSWDTSNAVNTINPHQIRLPINLMIALLFFQTKTPQLFSDIADHRVLASSSKATWTKIINPTKIFTRNINN